MKALSLTALTLILSTLAAVAGIDLGVPSGGTPYDPYLGPVRAVLSSLDAQKADMDHVKQLMKQGRSFRYHMDDPYVPAMPAVTARQHEGDCKDKALWLCDQLNDSSVRFVIGKASASAKISHAWVMWQNSGRWWVLDCTLRNAPIAADSIPSDRYIPLFSYSKGTCYRHNGTGGSMAAVASRKTAPVGANGPK